MSRKRKTTPAPAPESPEAIAHRMYQLAGSWGAVEALAGIGRLLEVPDRSHFAYEAAPWEQRWELWKGKTEDQVRKELRARILARVVSGELVNDPVGVYS